jgi:hypothetical protein
VHDMMFAMLLHVLSCDVAALANSMCQDLTQKAIPKSTSDTICISEGLLRRHKP